MFQPLLFFSMHLFQFALVFIFTFFHRFTSSSSSTSCHSCGEVMTSTLVNSSLITVISSLSFPAWVLRALLVCSFLPFLADRTNGRAYATVLRLSVCPSVRLSVCPSVTLCIVAKRCVLEQKLLLRAYRKSYMINRLVPKWMPLTFV